jgi:two-component system, NtrC family, sensor histidine kinase HydH
MRMNCAHGNGPVVGKSSGIGHDDVTFFESLKIYVGFTDASSARLKAFAPMARPNVGPIIDDFYRAIEEHPEAHAVITGGDAQIARLKNTLIRWLEELLDGPHDEAYCERRSRIGRMHVQVGLPQQFMFTAMNRIRVRLLEVAMEAALEERGETCAALHQILDLELAIMLHTYREDLMAHGLAVERLAIIGQMATGVSQELRNPLGVIESSMFLLRKHLGPTADEENVRRHMDRIGAELARSNKTIGDLLNLVQIRSPRKFPVTISDLVEHGITSAQLKSTTAIRSTVPEGLKFDLDFGQMVQVFGHLLKNAQQAMRGMDSAAITIDCATKDGHLLIRVTDTGPGVSAEIRQRIFEPLYSTGSQSAGLGLALCRKIVEAHGGTLELMPESGGAVFLITI